MYSTFLNSELTGREHLVTTSGKMSKTFLVPNNEIARTSSKNYIKRGNNVFQNREAWKPQQNVSLIVVLAYLVLSTCSVN